MLRLGTSTRLAKCLGKRGEGLLCYEEPSIPTKTFAHELAASTLTSTRRHCMSWVATSSRRYSWLISLASRRLEPP